MPVESWSGEVQKTFWSIQSHPYTQALISAIPEMNGEDPTGIPGSPKEFTKEEIGCDFAPRCTKAKENCACVVPEKVVLSDEHWALCPYCREE